MLKLNNKLGLSSFRFKIISWISTWHGAKFSSSMTCRNPSCIHLTTIRLPWATCSPCHPFRLFFYKGWCRGATLMRFFFFLIVQVFMWTFSKKVKCMSDFDESSVVILNVSICLEKSYFLFITFHLRLQDYKYWKSYCFRQYTYMYISLWDSLRGSLPQISWCTPLQEMEKNHPLSFGLFR